MKRVIITTGGTGGHIFPALAVAEEIKVRHKDAVVLFMGGKYGPEGDIAAQAGLEFVGLPVRGFIGRGLRMLGAGFGMLRGLTKAVIVMRRFKPDAVIGFGGYAAFAGVMAAKYVGVATAIHEQNSIPGVSNKILSRRVDRVFVSLPDVKATFPEEKTIFTGNPVRAAIAELVSGEERNEREIGKRVLILGGSQGAKAINDCVIANLNALIDAGVSLWHQAGAADVERVRDAYRKNGGEKMRVDGFIKDMAAAYEWADIVVCRAGATTIAELTCAALPAIFIPFPAATHDHQTHNARYLTAVGAAELLPQGKIEQGRGNPALLVERLEALLNDPEKLRSMSEVTRSLARPEAAAALVNAMEELVAPREAESNAIPQG
ncbi:undecaprenyldiphospho-muramoylpentapeptide beta-N-acetylglucosaminyltransferase [Desulfovibrio sp. OttesenSCG-928-O18]|nr:undecaprenyldiphospho-muramoylpentapeptide beta-N-acetylglucosaminyltransferase [Desulfovibrio sp. OttesenSCG-928-O18]